MTTDPSSTADGTPTTTFGQRIGRAMAEHGPLCVGIDPHPGLLAAWGLPDDATGLRSFAMTVVEALAGRVAALKPQSAFFERHGSAGIAVLEEVLAAARGAGTTQVVLDAKRGDIGSTMAGYADAYLAEGAPLACDALTVSPYLGFGSLGPAVEVAARTGRGLFVLALTSNPEGAEVQHAVLPTGYAAGGSAVARTVARAAAELNAAETARTGAALGSVGLVVGATVGSAADRLEMDLEQVRGPLLAPGVGAQGAGAAEIAQVFGAARHGVLASTSRAVLGAGPDPRHLLDAARRAADEVAVAVR
ncbi:orotidine-5'-phosphate decarboxylase [Actinotalea sp. C106]|uniref:orotidine-5'-phosphate decarboxylase n=1 Tax=Actinotalea sp. C106 TaxID=2908644 RepID=UPI0027E05668|nr:orotidine-5'-phosphate decarboxylase [Actinotalea sp. C106]